MVVKRIIAYFIDLLFCILLCEMLFQIQFLNPNYDAYYEASEKYMEVYEKALKEQDLSFTSSDEYKNATYELNKNGVSNVVLELVVYVAYFVGFQLWNKGQTLGKKLVKLKVESNRDDKLRWYQLLIRAIVLYGIYSEVIKLILLFTVSQGTYMNIVGVLEYIVTIIFYASGLMIILRKDGRGLHDLLGGTKVVRE